jgi:hypothetical protein
MKLPNLPLTLGYLLEVKETEIKHLIGTVLAMGISSCTNSMMADKDGSRLLMDLVS